MSSDAKRASNARYLSKFKTVTLRLTQEQMEEIKGAAEAAGESTCGYIIQAVYNRIEKERPSE